MKCNLCPVASSLSCLGESHHPACRDVADGRADRAAQLVQLANHLAFPALPQRRHIKPGIKPRVGVLAPILYQGGAESWLWNLLKSTATELDWVGCVVTEGGPDDPAVAAAIGRYVPIDHGADAARDLASRCDALIVWANSDLPGILAGLFTKPAIISVVHAPPGDSWGDRVYARHQGIDHWVAVSELASDALPAASRAAAPTSVIWNAVDADRLRVNRDRTAMRQAWGIPDGSPVLGLYQRLSPEKDPDAAVRAARSLPEPWQVVVVGNGPLAREIHDADLSNLHCFPGVPAAGDVLGAFDALLVASWYESFGLTLAEGLRLGVPVVSTKVGLAKMQAGLTYELPSDPTGEQIAAATLDAFRHGPKPGSMEFARSRLSADRMGREWADLIRQVVVVPETDRLRMAVDTCEYGQSGSCGCDGNPRICTRSGIPVAVRRADCYDCDFVA